MTERFMYLRYLNSHMSLPLVSLDWNLWSPVILRVSFSLLSLKHSEFSVSFFFSQLPLCLFPGILLCTLWSQSFTIRNILWSLHLICKCSFTSIRYKTYLCGKTRSPWNPLRKWSPSHMALVLIYTRRVDTSPQWSDLNSCLYSVPPSPLQATLFSLNSSNCCPHLWPSRSLF